MAGPWVMFPMLQHATAPAPSHTSHGTSSRVRIAVTPKAETLSSSLVCFVLGACQASPPVPPALRDFVVSPSLTAASSHDITGTPFTDLPANRVARVRPWLSFGIVVISRFAHLCSHPLEQNPDNCHFALEMPD